MIDDSALTSEHISIQVIPGRTDAYIADVQDMLNMLSHIGEASASIAVKMVLDDEKLSFEWISTERPPQLEGIIASLPQKRRIDVYLSLCCEYNVLFDWQNKLSQRIVKEDLRDCCKHVVMVETRLLTSLAVCGMHRGAFICDAVPFYSGETDVMHVTAWNNSTQNARFTFEGASADEAYDLTEATADTLDMDFEMKEQTLCIENVYLADYAQIEMYLNLLKKLHALAQSTLLTGAMSPEADDVFALLRFVVQGTDVVYQAAVAEF